MHTGEDLGIEIRGRETRFLAGGLDAALTLPVGAGQSPVGGLGSEATGSSWIL
jgi:hypothetical protein